MHIAHGLALADHPLPQPLSHPQTDGCRLLRRGDRKRRVERSLLGALHRRFQDADGHAALVPFCCCSGSERRIPTSCRYDVWEGSAFGKQGTKERRIRRVRGWCALLRPLECHDRRFCPRSDKAIDPTRVKTPYTENPLYNADVRDPVVPEGSHRVGVECGEQPGIRLAGRLGTAGPP